MEKNNKCHHLVDAVTTVGIVGKFDRRGNLFHCIFDSILDVFTCIADAFIRACIEAIFDFVFDFFASCFRLFVAGYRTGDYKCTSKDLEVFGNSHIFCC